MRMKKRLLLIAVAVLACLLLTACGSEPEGPQEFEYVLNSTGEWARLVRYQGEAAEVVIPDTLGGKPVKEIGEKAFAFAPHVTAITIPASVTKIDDPSFYTLPKLETITVSENSVGFTVVDGVLYHKKMKTVYCYPQGKAGDSYTLPDTITTIGAKAFYHSQLKKVEMGDKVTKILADAFEGSGQLEKVKLSAKLSQIYEKAFAGCAKLTGLTLPESLTSIAAGAFSGCESLTEMTVPAGVGVLDAGAFDGCVTLKTVKVLGKGVQRVSAQTFRGCTALESVQYAAEILGVGDEAFQGCKALKEFQLGNNVAIIGRYAFAGCEKLEEIALPETLSVIGAHALDGTPYLAALEGEYPMAGDGVVLAYRGAQTELTVPENAKNISFLREDVTKVTAAEGLLTLNDGAFANCEALEEIRLPNSVTKIGTDAFRGCKKLKSFTVPVGTTTIGEGCFVDCGSLEKFEVASGNATYTTDQGVLYDNSRKYLVWYPQGSAMTQYTLPFGPTFIADNAFRGAKNLVTVDCSQAQDVLAIGEYAFAECTALTSVKFTDNFATIGAHAFENDAQLKNFKLTYTMTKLGEAAFKGCEALGDQEISGNIAKLGDEALSGTKGTYTVQRNTLAEEFVKTWQLSYKRK